VEKYRTDVKVVNLSLLNTSWYIKQCRDNEPKVPITWTDEEIARLSPIYTEDGWVMVRDIAVGHILRSNEWRKPIYFAVTIPSETFSPYRELLEFEGLAYKVVKRKGQNMVNKEKVVDNLTSKYDYTSILDENWKRDRSVYLPAHTEHLIQNYAAAFFQMALMQHRDSLYEDAVRSLEVAIEISPQMQPLIQLLGWYYLDAGDTTRAVQFFEDYVEAQPNNLDLRFRLAGVYERTGQIAKAIGQLDAIMIIDPNNRDAMMAAVGIAISHNMVGKARQILSEWLGRHPGDSVAIQTLQDIERQLQADPPQTGGE
jgi:tetratricopeptide (TPR) repeat protein